MNNKRSDTFDLIHHCLSGEASGQERDRLADWLKASPKNRRLFSEFERIWHNTTPQEPNDDYPDADRNWQEIARKLHLDSTETPMRMFPMPHSTPARMWLSTRGRRALALAAAVTLIVGASVLLRSFNTNSSWREATTQNAQRMQLTLPDGSKIQLNSGSTLKYPVQFPESERTVSLAGEAFFEVAHHGNPFIVKTAHAQIRVLGTTFNIWAREEQTRVIVAEGRVSLKSVGRLDSSGVVVAAQQMSTCQKNAVPETPTPVVSELLLDWLHGGLVFDHTPLSEIVAELQPFYDVPIELENAALSEYTITGTFRDKPLATVLTSICLTLNLRYRFVNGKYVISK